MKIVKLLALTTIVVVMMCGGYARGFDMSVAREWAFEMEKVWELQQIGEDELLRPGEPRVADDGTLYCHDFERHLSYIIDGDGNAVSMTSSIESAFGSRLMVRGFLLNNQLTDFSFRPEQGGAPVANQAGPRRRPRSSMAPTLVFDGNGEIKAAVGSPGGSSIIGYVAATLIGMLDWNLSPDQAISMPHFLSRGGAVELEAGVGAEVLQGPLEAMGHEVKLKATNSGLHMVGSTEGGLTGAADPRREGVVLGD